MQIKFITTFLFIFFLALPSFAEKDLMLNFSVHSRNENISFPKGHVGTAGAYISFSEAADYSFLSEDTIRFKLHTPINFLVRENGSEYSVLMPHIDYKTTPEDVKGLKLLTSDEAKTLLFSRVSDGDMPYSRLIEASRERGSLLPYLKEGVIIPLEVFRGNISLRVYWNIEDIKRKGNKSEGSLGVSFNDVVRIDSGRLIYDGSSSSVYSMENLIDGRIKTYDVRAPETLSIISGIDTLKTLKNDMYGEFLSFTENGKKMIGFNPPKESDVVEFRPGKTCKELFK